MSDIPGKTAGDGARQNDDSREVTTESWLFGTRRKRDPDASGASWIGGVVTASDTSTQCRSSAGHGAGSGACSSGGDGGGGGGGCDGGGGGAC